MKIVVLNECFFGKSHIDRLKKLGKLTLYSGTNSEEKAIERLKDANIAIGDCFIAPFNKKVLESAKNLKLILVNSIGFDTLDINLVNKLGIKVANAAGSNKDAVAELAIGLMFAVNRKIVLGDRIMRQNPFEADPGNKKHRRFWGFNLYDKTLGVIGLGNIGASVAKIGQSLGMNVVGFNRSKKDIKGVKQISLKELLKISDVVSIHLALNKDTENIISKKELDLMKKTAIVINTARGKHVNTNDLYNALKSGQIAGAGLDVITEWNKNNPLTALDNVVLTPHIGSATSESFLENLPEILVKNAEAFVGGKPQNVVN